MAVHIARVQELERLFPGPGSVWEADDPALSPLLALAQRPLGIRQRTREASLAGEDLLARLLFHLRLATEEERCGRWIAADCFWNAVHSDFAIARLRAEFWPPVGDLSGSEVAQRFADEVLIDTHVAIINGYAAEDNPPAERVLAHAQKIVDGLPWSAMLPAPRSRFIERVCSVLSGVVRGATNTKAALELCGLFLELVEDTPQLRMIRADLHLQAAAAQTEAIDPHVDAVRALLGKHPEELALYSCLSALHHLRAVRSANSGRLSDALADAVRAQVLSGGSQDARGLIDELSGIMKKRQAQAAEIQERLNGNSSLGITAEGRLMMEDAKAGFSKFEATHASPEVEEWRHGRTRAFHRRLWTIVGLPETGERLDERAAALANLLDTVDLDAEAGALALALREGAGDGRDLAGIDWDGVARALSHRNEPVDDAAPADPVWVLPMPDRRASGDAEPFLYTFLGPNGKGLRRLAGVAAAALLAAFGLGAWDYLQTRERDTAFAALLAADQHGDETAGLAAVERFTAAKPFGADRRVWRVEELRRKMVDRPNLRTRDALYQSLLDAATRGDNRAVLADAERFLRTPLHHTVDPRNDDVRALYARAVIAWVGEQRGPIKETATLAAYKALANPTPKKEP